MKASIPPPTPAPALAEPAAPRGWPLLRLGFRPFYLGAAAFACLSVPVWVAVFLGRGSLPSTIDPLLWHAHEMLFGFAIAVIVGFLLTAGKAWTGLPTPRGALLGALAALWLAARIAAVGGSHALYAALDIVLLPAVAVALLRVLLRARNRRNLPLVAILLLLAVANLCFHLAVTGVIPLAPLQPLHAALALIVLLECVIAGRVVPMFTNNVTPGLNLRMRPAFERATLALSAIALASWILPVPPWFAAVALVFAAAANLHRQWTWRPWVTWDRPILWILHASYAWIPAGFMLLALGEAGLAPTSAGLHALAVGATGGLIVGMITRTARGHTGRALKASRLEVLAYAFVIAAAVLRVPLPLLAPQYFVVALVASALAWSAAFATYLVVFAPWLTSTRLDGKDG